MDHEELLKQCARVAGAPAYQVSESGEVTYDLEALPGLIETLTLNSILK